MTVQLQIEILWKHLNGQYYFTLYVIGFNITFVNTVPNFNCHHIVTQLLPRAMQLSARSGGT